MGAGGHGRGRGRLDTLHGDSVASQSTDAASLLVSPMRVGRSGDGGDGGIARTREGGRGSGERGSMDGAEEGGAALDLDPSDRAGDGTGGKQRDENEEEEEEEGATGASIEAGVGLDAPVSELPKKKRKKRKKKPKKKQPEQEAVLSMSGSAQQDLLGGIFGGVGVVGSAGGVVLAGEGVEKGVEGSGGRGTRGPGGRKSWFRKPSKQPVRSVSNPWRASAGPG